MKLGIDLGTTRTVVAAVQDGRHPLVAFDRGDAVREWIPGVAAATPAGIAYGWDALGGDPETRLVRSIKRLASRLAPDEPIEALAGASALDVMTGYLAALRRAIEAQSGLALAPGEPLEAMVAVPAGASGAQRYLTLEAFRRAGFTVLGLLNEPTAAAIEFAHRHLRESTPRSPKRYVVVYDLGGGTFDASAVALAGQRFELLATEGIGRLGGDDFDAEILVMALETLGVGLDSVDLALGPALLERCREAKEGLGPQSRRLLVDLSEELPGTSPAILPAAELYARCQPLVDETLACLGRLFERLPAHGIASHAARELAAVYVAGGSAAFPPVLRSLRAAHPRKLKVALQPQAATAVGLAVAADPEAGVVVREATTRHLGVWREAEGGHAKVFDRIVSKDELPGDGGALVLERRYRPAHRVGHLRFVECTDLTPGGEPAGDLAPAGELLFPYDPALAEAALETVPAGRCASVGSEEIVETWTCGADGRVSVVIENRTRGYRREHRLGERATPTRSSRPGAAPAPSTTPAC